MKIININYCYNPAFSSITPAKLKELEANTTITETMEKYGKKSLQDIVKCWHNYDPSSSAEWQPIDDKLVNEISRELQKLDIIHGGLYTSLGNDVLEAYGLSDDECR